MIHLRVWGTLPRLSASLQCLATGQARTLTHKNNPVPQTLGRGPWRCTSHLCLPQSLQVPSIRLSGSSHLCLPQSLQVPSVRLSGSSCLCLPPPLRVPSVRESVCRSGTRVGGLRPLSTRSGLAVRVAEDSVHLTLAGREVGVPLVWLRDHCRCEICYNSTTWQKNVDNYSLQGLSVLHIEIKEDSLLVTWQDGHASEYSLQWLASNFHAPPTQVERFLWDGPSMNEQQIPTTGFYRHMNSEEGLKDTLSNIIKYGFCIVEGAPATEEGTLAVSDRVSFLQETVYGRYNTMVSGEMSRSDTAYTSLPLGAHNDTTYFTLPAGIQVFHCLEHDGEGGKTLLVDGFRAAEKLRSVNPDFFNTLTTTTIPHEYIDRPSQYHLYSLGTVLSIDLMTGALTQIRFNPYDRAPLRTVTPEDLPLFYDSYAALTDIIRSKDSEFWVKLKPGMVLLVDNWRVMHGRSAFTGRRVICGCYLPRDDWTSRARVMGLL